MRVTDGTTRARLSVAIDLLALVAFVLVGMRSHRSGSTLLVFARTAMPLLVAWLACALALRTYRPPSSRSLAWTILLAVPAGVLVRVRLVGSPQGWRILVFLGVALTFSSLFVVAGRAIVSLLSRRSERRRRAAVSAVRSSPRRWSARASDSLLTEVADPNAEGASP